MGKKNFIVLSKKKKYFEKISFLLMYYIADLATNKMIEIVLLKLNIYDPTLYLALSLLFL